MGCRRSQEQGLPARPPSREGQGSSLLISSPSAMGSINLGDAQGADIPCKDVRVGSSPTSSTTAQRAPSAGTASTGSTARVSTWALHHLRVAARPM